MNNKTALIILAHGFEELEAVAPIDLLRRAGVRVTVASHEDDLLVTGRNSIVLKADILLNTALGQDYDLVVLPGGPGHRSLCADIRLLERLREQVDSGRLVAAICAAPTVLHEAGVLQGKKYTAHFTVAEKLTAVIPHQAVVVDGPIITSRGAGTATEFGLALVEQLVGEEQARAIAAAIHYQLGK